VRSRRPKHRTLSKFDENTDAIRKETMDTRRALQQKYEESVATMEKELQGRSEQLRREFQSGVMDKGEADRRLLAAMLTARKHLESERARMQREMNDKLERAEVKLNEKVSHVQGRYKLWSVVLPPIPPLVIALTVLFVRRIRESEGIPVSRRKK
jgi:hypothetical protein